MLCKHESVMVTIESVITIHYRSGEGNVFSHVCLTVHGRSYATITHDALDLTIQGHPLYLAWP